MANQSPGFMRPGSWAGYSAICISPEGTSPNVSSVAGRPDVMRPDWHHGLSPKRRRLQQSMPPVDCVGLTMKPPPFEYHDPKSVSEAIAILRSHANSKLLAGGQSLMPMLNMRYVQPDHIVDLNKIDALSYIVEDDDVIRI